MARQDDQSPQFLGMGNVRPAGEAVTQAQRRPRGKLVLAKGARQDPMDANGEALVMWRLDRVVYAPSRGYAFHLQTCRNVQGSAKTVRFCTLQEAVERGLQPGQCCTAGRLEMVENRP